MQTQNLQPVSKNCFVCGVENPFGLHMRFMESVPDAQGHAVVTAEYTVPAHYQGYPGVVHGGIIATMLDEVTSRTVFRGDSPRFVVTAQLSLRYRKPVPVETPLKLTGRVVEDKGRVLRVSGEIQNVDGVVLAEAEATLVEVGVSFFGDMLSQEVLGWRINPDQGENNSVEER